MSGFSANAILAVKDISTKCEALFTDFQETSMMESGFEELVRIIAFTMSQTLYSRSASLHPEIQMVPEKFQSNLARCKVEQKLKRQ